MRVPVTKDPFFLAHLLKKMPLDHAVPDCKTTPNNVRFSCESQGEFREWKKNNTQNSPVSLASLLQSENLPLSGVIKHGLLENPP